MEGLRGSWGRPWGILGTPGEAFGGPWGIPGSSLGILGCTLGVLKTIEANTFDTPSAFLLHTVGGPRFRSCAVFALSSLLRASLVTVVGWKVQLHSSSSGECPLAVSACCPETLVACYVHACFQELFLGATSNPTANHEMVCEREAKYRIELGPYMYRGRLLPVGSRTLKLCCCKLTMLHLELGQKHKRLCYNH